MVMRGSSRAREGRGEGEEEQKDLDGQPRREIVQYYHSLHSVTSMQNWLTALVHVFQSVAASRTSDQLNLALGS